MPYTTKKDADRHLFYSFNGAMERNLLKLFEALVDNQLQSNLVLPKLSAHEVNIIY